MTSFGLLQMPRYVQPLLVVAYGAVALSGVLAWTGRRTDGSFAAQWYAVAALFLLPWILTATQAVLLWMPVRGVVQNITAVWYGQAVWSLWLAPLALAGAYYVVPKVTGRVLPTYESAPLGFWTLIFTGTWTGGRHLVGGPVPAWVPTLAVVGCSLLLFHYLVIALNFRPVLASSDSSIKFIRFGVVAYLLTGVLELFTSFRAIALETQFTFLAGALEQLGAYGGLSMLFFGAITFMVPRLSGGEWASSALSAGHRVLVTLGLLLSVATLVWAGLIQSGGLLDSKTAMVDILGRVRLPLLLNSGAQFALLSANLLLLVNLCRTACPCAVDGSSLSSLAGKPAAAGGHLS
jgi:cytochrome c oxidase cbb3-type subunit 1